MPKPHFNRPEAFHLGFLPVTGSAPLIVAQQKNFFSTHDVKVKLTCEIGWATVREKLIHGELDGAAAVAGLAAGLRMGSNSQACPVIAPLVLSLQGNAITLSKTLYEGGVRDSVTLCQWSRNQQHRVLTFGVISRWSSHYFLLRDWLASGGLRVDRDVRLVIIPPPLMTKLLSTGAIDGFCAGEPWNSASVINGHGWIAATTAELSPQHVEKILLLNEPTARANTEATSRLLKAIRLSCAWCDEPANQSEVAEILQASGHFPVPQAALAASLVGPLEDGAGRKRSSDGFHVFHRHEANTPTPDRAMWLMRGLRSHGVVAAAQEASLRDSIVASWGVMGSISANESTQPKVIPSLKAKSKSTTAHEGEVR